MNTITHDIFVTVMPSKNFCKQMQRQARSTKMFKLLAVLKGLRKDLWACHYNGWFYRGGLYHDRYSQC